MRKLNKKGFTIVELVIVIAVIAILAAVLIPTFSGIVEKANKSSVQQEAANLYKEVLAIDLADGKQDGKDNSKEITTDSEKAFDYTIANDGSVTFKTGNDKYTATFEEGKWTVTEGKYVKSSANAGNGSKNAQGGGEGDN